MTNIYYIPRDILKEIFLYAIDTRTNGTIRKSILSLKCICKRWNEILNNDFVKKYQTLNYNYELEIEWEKGIWKNYRMANGRLSRISSISRNNSRGLHQLVDSFDSISFTENYCAVLAEKVVRIYDENSKLINKCQMPKEVNEWKYINICETTMGLAIRIIRYEYSTLNKIYIIKGSKMEYFTKYESTFTFPFILYDGCLIPPKYHQSDPICKVKYYKTGEVVSFNRMTGFDCTKYSIFCAITKNKIKIHDVGNPKKKTIVTIKSTKQLKGDLYAITETIELRERWTCKEIKIFYDPITGDKIR